MRLRLSAYPIGPGGPWLLILGTTAAILLISLAALVPPAPLPHDAPTGRFSEAKARDIVRQLTERIGLRVNGTEGHAQAARYLEAELRNVPRIEVEMQRYSGTHVHKFLPSVPLVFQTTNVLGRLPGRTTDSILLDAHFDTRPDSVGAADDAAGVACIVEMLRVLAAGPMLDRTIVVNLNGAEEIGMLGAVAFLQHPWAKDVHAYVYLEALPGGRALLVGAGPGNPWLAASYARSVAAPLGNVLGQELAQSGLLPFNGDFTPFHEAGLVGLDVAMVGDAWGVHTQLDRLDRLEPGGIQHMGDSALAATRALASSANLLVPTTTPGVFYDILGKTMVSYSASVGRILGFLALLGFVSLVLRARFFYWVTLRGVLTAWAWNCLGVLAGVLAALLPAAALKILAQRSLGWFDSPALLLPCFALPAAAGMLAMRGWWRARALHKAVGNEDHVALTGWMGSILFWAVPLALATMAGAGAGYIPLFWVVAGSAGLLVASVYPRARLVAALLGFVPGAIVTIEAATIIVASIVPMAGMTPSNVPTDLVIAGLVGLTTCLVGVVAFTIPCRTGGAAKAIIVCTALGVAGIVLTAVHAPYSASRPKRLLAVHAADGDRSSLLLAGAGPDGMAPLRGILPDATRAPATWPALDLFMAPFSHVLPAALPHMPAPRVQVKASDYDAATDTRQVLLHLEGTSPQLRLSFPAQSLVAWAASPELGPPTDGRHLVHFEGVPPEGVDFQVTLRGWQAVEVDLRGIDGAPATGPEMERLRTRLPAWVTLTSYSYRLARVKI